MKKKAVTPVMEQFYNVKKGHPNAILLFRMGDFYETFENDAIKTSEILGITLTKRSNGAAADIPLAGFPYHSLDQHLHKLLKAGYRVAICEQVEDPKKSKGIVKREVTEVVSPGITISDQYLNQKENNYLICIYKEKNKFGFGILDHSTGEFKAGERSISKLKTLIQQFTPSEIIVSKAQLDEFKLKIGKEYFFTTYHDWMFDQATCYNRLTEHFRLKNLKGFGLEKLNLSICSCGVIIDFIKKNCKTNIDHISSLSVIREEGFMNLDGFTIKNLEIFNSLNSNKNQNTLINCIDFTLTAAGGRMLKSWIRNPLTNKKKIDYRHNLIEALQQNKSLANSICKYLKKLSDIERIIARLNVNRVSPRELQQLGYSLKICNDIKSEIFIYESNRLNSLFVNFYDLRKIIDIIINSLNDELPSKLSQGNVIKTGVNIKLDEIRKIQNDANNWLIKYQEKQRALTQINSLKIKFNKIFGYFIEVTKSNIHQVPDNYIRKQTLTNAERYFTIDLKKFEENIFNANENIIELEKIIFEKLRISVIEYSKQIQDNAQILSILDVICGFFKLAEQYNYCKPILEVSNLIDIKNGRHPIIEQILPMNEQFIPNDIYLDSNRKQIAILTGPNMSGKSTFLRQIALIVLMAQIGSFVSADYAKIGIVDQIFTRVGASDNLAAGESTFLVEMNETANILNNATKDSLIILDEIGRGTSTYDGLSIAWAIIEYLHNKVSIRAKTLFATHYHELVNLGEKLSKAFNLNVFVKEFNDQIIFMRKIIKGGADKSYGIHVAELAGIPNIITKRSKEILEGLNKNQNIKNDIKVQEKISQKKSLIKQNEILNELKKTNINKLTPLQAITLLDKLKKKYDI